MAIRSLICTTLGHVDHGKSSILDKIRGSAVVRSEPGQITQAIGASIIPLEVIRKICGRLLDSLNVKITIPGLLFIDTPGHAAFTNLRRRGGNLADIAILVVDINEGVKPQTVESVEILKQYKTPFVVVANKIDLLPGWMPSADVLLKGIASQNEQVQRLLDTKLYELVGKLSGLKLDSERFDRVDDYTKQVAIVPCSAKTGEGIPELLMVLTGLAQRYLESCLTCDVGGFAHGTVLEVKKEKGLGNTLDVIIYDGSLKKGDTIVIGGLDKPTVTKVKALLEPMPLSEMRDKKVKFKPVDRMAAAIGVKISALGIEHVVAGMPLISTSEKELEKTKVAVQKEVAEVIIETEKEGIIAKADSLGSLEALTKLLKEKNMAVKAASIGEITKKDVLEAESNYEKDPLKAAVLGFNVAAGEDAVLLAGRKVKILTNDVIYRLIEEFERWVEEEKRRGEAKELDLVVRPCKFQVLTGYVFRQSNPAVVGVEILAGVLRTGMPVLKGGREVTEIKSIQSEKESISEAEKGKKVAVSLEKVSVGRQISEGEVLYSAVPEKDFRKLKKLKRYLKEEEISVLKEIAEQMRKDNPVWGV
jgi:translation initiation factor 5B